MATANVTDKRLYESVSLVASGLPWPLGVEAAEHFVAALQVEQESSSIEKKGAGLAATITSCDHRTCMRWSLINRNGFW